MRKTWFKTLCLTLLALAVFVLSARFTIQIPGIAVPQTAQTIALLILLALLPARIGIYTVLLYLILGALGFPFFADGASGLDYLFGKTGGYLAGFLIVAIWLRFIIRRLPLQKWWLSFFVAVKAHVAILFFGWLWLGWETGYRVAFAYGVQPFLVGGLVKSLLAMPALVFARRSQRFIAKYLGLQRF